MTNVGLSTSKIVKPFETKLFFFKYALTRSNGVLEIQLLNETIKQIFLLNFFYGFCWYYYWRKKERSIILLKKKKFNEPGSTSSSVSIVEMLFCVLLLFVLKYSCVSGKSRWSGFRLSILVRSIVCDALKGYEL